MSFINPYELNSLMLAPAMPVGFDSSPLRDSLAIEASMREKIFNLFYFSKSGIITELGAVAYELEDSDAEKNAFLARSVTEALLICKKYPVPKAFAGLTDVSYFSLTRIGTHLEVFEEIFSLLGAPANPLCCITPIVDGVPTIDLVKDHSPFLFTKHKGHPKVGIGDMPDYLESYMTPAGLDMARLIHDDHFKAIRLLFNGRSYLSCMKLIVSLIDTMSAIEYGNTSGTFTKWLDAYADLSPLGVTAPQLWELRNSILHMSNLDSRKVVNGQEQRIGFLVGAQGMAPINDAGIIYFNLADLIPIIASALSQWLPSINKDAAKLAVFIERYDRILSDARVSIVKNPVEKLFAVQNKNKIESGLEASQKSPL
jgi:hypothetical protein